MKTEFFGENMMVRRRWAMATVIAVSTVAPLAVLPASAASAYSAYKYTACGRFKSQVLGYMYMDWDHDFTGIDKAEVWNRRSQVNTLYSTSCGAGSTQATSVSDLRFKTIVRFGGVGIDNCSIGSGGGTCTGGATQKTYDSGWIYPANNSNGTHTVSHVAADAGTVGYMNSITNRLEARWTNGANVYDDYIQDQVTG